MMQVSGVNIYPVKSLTGVALQEVIVTKRGFQHDRRWMLTDRENMFFTQRQFPKMATITVEVTGNGLRVTSKDGDILNIPFRPESGERRQVTIWQSVCEAEVYDDQVNEWFGRVLDIDCQLVHMPDTTERHVSERFDSGNDIVSFADGYPVMLLGEKSLEELNRRIAESGSADKEVRVPLPMNRFRPNIVVSGSDAFAEDGWQRIRIGEVVFRVVKPCARCSITTVDQVQGKFTGKEPLRTFAKFRAARDVYPETFESFGIPAPDVLFGQNLIPESSGGMISIGDSVEVIERKARI